MNIWQGARVRLRGVEPGDWEAFDRWNNEASIRLHEKLGFQLEERLRRMIFTGGAYHDTLIFGLTAEEFCRSLA